MRDARNCGARRERRGAVLRQLRRLAEDEIDHGSEGIGNEGLSVGEALLKPTIVVGDSAAPHEAPQGGHRRVPVGAPDDQDAAGEQQTEESSLSSEKFAMDLPATLRTHASRQGVVVVPPLSVCCGGKAAFVTRPRERRVAASISGCGRRRSHKSSSQTRDRFVVASAPPPPPPRHPVHRAPCARTRISRRHRGTRVGTSRTNVAAVLLIPTGKRVLPPYSLGAISYPYQSPGCRQQSPSIPTP